MIEAIRPGPKADGLEVSITKLCHWFGFARRSFYYQASRATPKVNPAFSEPIKALIEDEPSFGYRTVANLLGFNKNTARGSSSSRAGRSGSGPLAIDRG